VPRDTGGVAGAMLVELAVRGDELELAATARPTQMAVRFPLEVESLARSVEQAARLVAVLAGSDAAPPALRARPIHPAAHELILLARHDARRDRAMLAAAVERCERALVLASGDPRVLAALAISQAQLAFYDARGAEGLLDAAARNALSALAADPELAEGHVARAHIELHAGRPVIAAVCFRAAIARAPLMFEAHEWLGRMLLEAGFVVDATARLTDAFATGALPVLRWALALAHALDGRWDEVDRASSELPGLAVDRGHGFRLRLAAWRRNRDGELAAHAELAGLSGGATFERELVLAVYDPIRPWAARRDAILAMVDDRTLPGARRRAFMAQLAAEGAARAGDVETCLSMLLRANTEGLFHLHWLDRCPLLDSVRGEPRYTVIRGDVARRAEAIHDALYSDHRDDATVATDAAGSRP
jgi:serine/threonine-protein kinase